MGKYKILHITPHLGGGVGSVLTKYLKHTKSNKNYKHSLISLEDINTSSKKVLMDNNIPYKENLSANYKKILKEIYNFDIIIIHWWNHPMLYKLMTKYTLPKCRVIIWSHISGLFAPSNFTKPLFDYADKFVFTTPISYDTSIVKKLPKHNLNKTNIICSTVGVEHLKNIKKEQHKSFNIGYLGTVDYSKLHKDFLKMSNNVDIEDINFIVCGGNNEKQIEQEAIKKGVSKKFTFTGNIVNIQEYLAKFDIFGYPLSPYHFGTCDQALKEAMTCGIVPVVFNNPMEKSIIQHFQTGIIVNNKNEYSDAIKLLYEDYQLREKLSKNAKIFAQNNFSLDKMIDKWEKLFDEILHIKPLKKKWNSRYQGKLITPLQIFLESTGKNKKYFNNLLINKTKKNQIIKKRVFNEIWECSTKGTLNHYCNIFKDKELNKLRVKFNNILEGK
ncbi:glycosyltransferase family 4 protein [Aliarcobacter skirrowii]|uniref:glycosyltransferase family 4 protein n=1 Tax=Aliarcobacter skirrowii TaxID=28200 RepID=UPI0029A7298F|nr:glycosyltransferase family 4 protein [Aliarcobacter skirrowii]MDX4058509.1 glycosyltransferase family 4 protein [Aliarcobacter skirrowii]